MTTVILTASLTTDVARTAHGMDSSVLLIDEILSTEHVGWETTLYVGDVEFYRTKAGPIPNHQLRISVSPSAKVAALNYLDHDDCAMPSANSFNSQGPHPTVDLIFNGTTGAVFPRDSLIPIANARLALLEWLRTQTRPTCIEWKAFDLA